MAVTMNGYTRIDTLDPRLALVDVAGHATRLLGGPVARVLVEVGRRFHAEVEPVATFNGWRNASLNAGSGGIPNSNHLSGTAVDINGYRHPRYRHGTFSAAQVAAIRRILADLGGVVRWGGDWGSQVDEMHFEVVASVAQVSNAVSNLGSVPDAPNIPELDPLEEDDMAGEGAAILAVVQGLAATAANIEKILAVDGGNGIRGDVQSTHADLLTGVDEIRAARVQIREVADALGRVAPAGGTNTEQVRQIVAAELAKLRLTTA